MSFKPPNKMQLWATQQSACCSFRLSTNFGDFPGHCCEDFASVVMSGGCSLLPGTDFSLRRLLLLRTTDSRAFGLQQLQLPAVEHRLDSCGSRA